MKLKQPPSEEFVAQLVTQTMIYVAQEGVVCVTTNVDMLALTQVKL